MIARFWSAGNPTSGISLVCRKTLIQPKPGKTRSENKRTRSSNSKYLQNKCSLTTKLVREPEYHHKDDNNVAKS